MDRNTFTGLFLIMIILGGSFYFFRPSEAELKKAKETERIDSLKKAGAVIAPKDTVIKASPIAPVVDSLALKGPFGTAIAAMRLNPPSTFESRRHLSLACAPSFAFAAARLSARCAVLL